MVLFWILVSTMFVSSIAFIGIITLLFRKELIKKITLTLVALSAGTLLGNAFMHLIPEAITINNSMQTYLLILFGFILFYLVEKLLHWRHCHDSNCPKHSFASMNLIGDSMHNFIDGLIIAGSFIVSPAVGFTTTITVALHEIPQEMGDFGVLIHGGFSKKRALLLNFLVAFTAVLGGIIGYYLSGIYSNLGSILLPLTAGGFIYIAASDLIPEIRKETNTKKSIINFLIFIFGVALMYLLLFLEK